jgi:hypothetical protein
MVELAVSLAHNGFPDKKLRGDLRRHFLGVGCVIYAPAGVAVALPAVLHDTPNICLDDGGRDSRVHAGGIVVPKALAVPVVHIACFAMDAGFNAVDDLT